MKEAALAAAVAINFCFLAVDFKFPQLFCCYRILRRRDKWES